MPDYDDFPVPNYWPVKIVRETLVKAADEIERRGWYQGDWFDCGVPLDDPIPDDAACCGKGAVAVAVAVASGGRVFGGVFTVPSFIDTEVYIDRYVGSYLWDVPLFAEWQDEPGRTKEEVVALFRFLGKADNA